MRIRIITVGGMTGGIATRFGLDDLGFEIQLWRNFVYKSSPGTGPAQLGLGTCSAPCKMSTGSLSQG
jgi:hypothetical protein